MTIKKINNKKYFIEGNIPVSIFREGKDFVAYSQALDISTCGKTLKQAKERFSEIVEIFFEETVAKGNLVKVLTDLGWSMKSNYWYPPLIVSHDFLNLEKEFSVAR